MKKFLAAAALVVAAIAVPSPANADWGTPGTAHFSTDRGCTSVEVVKVVRGKKVSSKVVTSCPFTTERAPYRTNAIDWD